MEKILIINSAEPGVLEFSRDLANILQTTNYPSQIVEYKEAPKTKMEFYSGIIISGSPQGDDIVDHHLLYFSWIKKIKKPVLGICAGHHIIGALYGAKLLRSQEPESGDFYIEVVKDDILFDGIPQIFKVKQMHNDSISLPEEFDLLATSSTCKNQLMKHKQKPLYSCQFHPEYFNHELIYNFAKILNQ